MMIDNMKFLLGHYGHNVLHLLNTDSIECFSGVSLYTIFP
jgi:hypothetical protein